ncbi:cell growth-regulating nucleolar protein [Bradysia coprophila]|uniref:cell growth-regulating nucleolar protein n=1 Tax=Bradysia coprophila TaxID=38358 RepID=UPI00187DB225|nr:cell growth-regulating nucleolar protein [Bradysia coprophila]
MVFFTCNHCGESLKKPSVEKHYQWKSCRGAVPFLTCVDCLKDFKGDEFKEHTKCITEEEKYSAKGFVAKPNKNKGEKKQESWTETLQSLLTKPGVDPQVRYIVEKIAAQTNVPRKKPKFINFVKNSLKISMDNANKVWNVVEEALEEFKQIAEANKQKKELEKKAPENGNAESVPLIPENGQDKKKKKKKESKMETDDTNGTDVQNGKSRKRARETSTADDGSVKKKKKKNKSNGAIDSEIGDESLTTNGNHENEQGQDSTMVDDAKFNWQSNIVTILSKKKAPMAIDKLKSKVVKKYATHTSNAVTASVEKKFLKKLKATPNVTITNEFVKLEE